MGELGQPVMDAVAAGAEHPRQQPVVSFTLGAEGDEVQAVLRGRSVRHTAAEDLELMPMLIVHLDTGDVRSCGLCRNRQLDAVDLRPADDLLLLAERKPVEGGKVMHPAHCKDVTPALPWLTARHHDNFWSASRRRVGRSVYESGHVVAVVVGGSRALSGK